MKPPILNDEQVVERKGKYWSIVDDREAQRDADVSWFQEEISKLKPLSDEEIKQANLVGGQQYLLALEHSLEIPSLEIMCNRAMVQAQLNSIKKELLEKLEGK